MNNNPQEHEVELLYYFLGSVCEIISIFACYLMIETVLGRVYSIACSLVLLIIVFLIICIMEYAYFALL